MSQLYIRVKTGFYTHRKTVKLRSKIGNDAFWIPPRLWAYAAENQPDGNMESYTSEEMSELLGCQRYASSILQALKDCGFVDKNGMIHDWEEHNGYHKTFSDRAKKAADARWGKGETGERQRKEEIGDKHCSSIAPSIGERLSKLFGRNKTTPLSYLESSSISEISRREFILDEVAAVELFHQRENKYFPKSLSSLVTQWDKFFDQGRVWKPNLTPQQERDRQIKVKEF